MRRTSILGLVLLMVVIIAVPASAKQGDVTKINEGTQAFAKAFLAKD